MHTRTFLVFSGLVFLSCLVIAAGGQGGVGQQKADKTEDGKADDREMFPVVDLEKLAKNRKPAKANGVQLEMTPTVREAAEGTLIDLHWKLTNIGARSPLIMTKPLIDQPTASTFVTFYAVTTGQNYARRRSYLTTLEFVPPPALEPSISMPKIEKQWYVAIALNKNATGAITVDLAGLKEYFLKSFPDEVHMHAPPKFYVALLHQPFDRGERVDLDAWTGKLQLPPTAVPAIDKW